MVIKKRSASKAQKKLKLKKETIRDLGTKGKDVKGGGVQMGGGGGGRCSYAVGPKHTETCNCTITCLYTCLCAK